VCVCTISEMVDANMFCFCLSALEFGISGTGFCFERKISEGRESIARSTKFV
jgi:hypothetical protein